MCNHVFSPAPREINSNITIQYIYINIYIYIYVKILNCIIYMCVCPSLFLSSSLNIMPYTLACWLSVSSILYYTRRFLPRHGNDKLPLVALQLHMLGSCWAVQEPVQISCMWLRYVSSIYLRPKRRVLTKGEQNGKAMQNILQPQQVISSCCFCIP